MNCHQLEELSEAMIQFYEKMSSWEHGVAKNRGLSPRQNHTIEIVGHAGSIRMKPLAEKLSITTGTLTVMIDRLEKSGYVYRRKDPQDKRAFNIVLTRKGLKIHKEHHCFHLKLAQDIISRLDPAQAECFAQTLMKINESL